MATPFMISNKVINTIQSLPSDDQAIISAAIVNEMILGRDPRETLTPAQMIVYTFIRFNIAQDTRRNCI